MTTLALDLSKDGELAGGPSSGPAPGCSGLGKRACRKKGSCRWKDNKKKCTKRDYGVPLTQEQAEAIMRISQSRMTGGSSTGDDGQPRVDDSDELGDGEAMITMGGAKRGEQFVKGKTEETQLFGKKSFRLSRQQLTSAGAPWQSTKMYRPEAVHAEKCEKKSKVCSACTAKKDCWHGFGDISDASQQTGLEINVPKGKVGFEYVASIWASCIKGRKDGFWDVIVQQSQNADIRVELNGKEVPKNTRNLDVYARAFGVVAYKFHMTSDEIGPDAKIKIFLSPTAQNSVASAKLVVFALANKWVDTCMDRNYCLKSLGDGSDKEFELRNSNRRQYECLQGKPETSLVIACNA